MTSSKQRSQSVAGIRSSSPSVLARLLEANTDNIIELLHELASADRENLLAGAEDYFARGGSSGISDANPAEFTNPTDYFAPLTAEEEQKCQEWVEAEMKLVLAARDLMLNPEVYALWDCDISEIPFLVDEVLRSSNAKEPFYAYEILNSREEMLIRNGDIHNGGFDSGLSAVTERGEEFLRAKYPRSQDLIVASFEMGELSKLEWEVLASVDETKYRDDRVFGRVIEDENLFDHE